MVEAQHQVSTLKLVDTVEEQAVLEELIDTAKPPLPAGDEFVGLHFLLATPFRYPPLRHGSRFGARTERGLWYGSEHGRSAMAEVAFYRLLFLAGSSFEFPSTSTEHTLFHVAIATKAGIDLARGPFRRYAAQLASPSSYAATQPLGRAMREAGIEAFRYRSARDPDGGANVAAFTPRAFAARRPSPPAPPTWQCTTTPAEVIFRRRDVLQHEDVVFPREVFLVGGALPVPQ